MTKDPRTYTAEELADEAGLGRDRVGWLISIGMLRPVTPGRFRPGDVFRAKMIAALLHAGFTANLIGWAVEQGLNLDHVDNYVVVEPAPRSPRSFAAFVDELGPPGASLPALYRMLGLPEPDPSGGIDVNEEEMWRTFFAGWDMASDAETSARAARMIGVGTRMTAQGWPSLLEEQITGPARQRFLRGELDRYPPDVIEAAARVIRLMPVMMSWLAQRYVEQIVVGGIVDGFEEVLAARGVVPPPASSPPPAVVFVDLSDYTRITEERGDQAAVRMAASLQERAERVASSRDGRIVKLIGDGAMLRFDDAPDGVAAALELVATLDADPAVGAHAGVHAGPVVERDGDLFGRTVNLASRIADAAAAGEVVVSEEVVDATEDAGFAFEPIDTTSLKGVTDPVPLFRATTRRARSTDATGAPS